MPPKASHHLLDPENWLSNRLIQSLVKKKLTLKSRSANRIPLDASVESLSASLLSFPSHKTGGEEKRGEAGYSQSPLVVLQQKAPGEKGRSRGL